MNKITVIAIAAASFFAGLSLGQLLGGKGGFGCNNGNTVVNNYGEDFEDMDDYSEETSDEDYSF